MMTHNVVSKEAVSVVIATLGSSDLNKSILCLRNGTLPPAEILICIPEKEADSVKDLQADDVRIVVTACRGQVAQRAEGFKRVKHSFVLQLDDDIIVSNNLIECLVNVLKNNSEAAVAPGYFDLKTGNPLHRRPHVGFIYKIYLVLINGNTQYSEGAITDAGLNIGVDTTMSDQIIREVEWLPGGCLMHKKEHLIIDNYFPFSGKAYCEDLIQSHLLITKKIKLLVCSEAQCWTQLDSTYKSFVHLFHQKFDELKKREYFIKLSGRSLTRMYIFFFLNLTYTVLKHLKRSIS